MLISDSLSMVFVHVPKTGGDSLDKLLRAQVDDVRKQDGTRHAPYRRILANEPALSGYYSFGMVRNPWARMVSWYSMIDKWNHAYGPASGKPQVKRGGMKDGNAMWRKVATYEDFREFVLRGTEEIPRIATPQLDYLVAPGRTVDHVGRTETLREDVLTIQRRLGLPEVEAPHHNKSGATRHWREFYDDTTRARIADVYAKDCSEWGYRFTD